MSKDVSDILWGDYPRHRPTDGEKAGDTDTLHYTPSEWICLGNHLGGVVAGLQKAVNTL